MESFEAIVRILLARIRVHQIPRKVPSVEEVLPTEKSGRRLYRTPVTAWGIPAGSSVPASRFPQLDPARQPAEPRVEKSQRRRREERRLPEVHEVPTPRGLLACHPQRPVGKV